MKQTHLFSVITPLLLLLTLCLSSCGNDEESVAEKSTRPVRYAILKANDSDNSRTFSGTAIAAKESVLSFKVAGTLKTIPVKVGDVITTGDILAELDSTDLQVDLNAAQASLKTAQADAKAAQTTMNTSRSNYARIEKLYEADNVSLSEFEQARGEFETAKAQRLAALSQITTAKTQLQAAKNQFNYSRLIAPFDGVVNTITVEENEEVTPGAGVIRLSGLENVEVKVNLSDLYISRIAKGMATKVTFPAIDKESFEGEVNEIPYAASDSPTYPVTITLISQDSRLRPGMAAEVHFQFGSSAQTGKLHLPADGVSEDSTGNFVYVLKPAEDNTALATKRAVQLGPLTAHGFEVVDGIEPGEIIATSGLQILLDGMKVKLLDDPIKQW